MQVLFLASQANGAPLLPRLLLSALALVSPPLSLLSSLKIFHPVFYEYLGHSTLTNTQTHTHARPQPAQAAYIMLMQGLRH